MSMTSPFMEPEVSGMTYAVGDIHGCRSELDRLLDAIDVHSAGRKYKLVFLGDYIDKGPDSHGVIERLIALKNRKHADVVFLKGNHEDLMARAARGDTTALKKWLTMDGSSVLRQFGCARATDLPEGVVRWAEAMPTLHSDEHRIFVHAGLDPDLPFDRQTDEIRLTMRGGFLERDVNFGKHLVHGHTPQMDGCPDLRVYRTNLDTGVVFTGCLTAALFAPGAGGPSAILATRRPDKVISVPLN